MEHLDRFGGIRDALFEALIDRFQDVLGPLPLGDVAHDVDRAGQLSRGVQHGVDGHEEAAIADCRFHRLAVQAVPQPQDGASRNRRGCGMHDFVAEAVFQVGLRFAEEGLRRPVGTADPLLGVQQKDRVAHRIECGLPLLGRVRNASSACLRSVMSREFRTMPPTAGSSSELLPTVCSRPPGTVTGADPRSAAPPARAVDGSLERTAAAPPRGRRDARVRTYCGRPDRQRHNPACVSPWGFPA